MQTCIICCSLLASCITWCAVCLTVQLSGSDLFPVLAEGSKPALCNQYKSPNHSIVLKEVMFCWPWTFSPLTAKYRLSKVGLVFASCDEKPRSRKERKTWIISSSKRAPGRSLPGSFLQISLNKCYTQRMLLWPANATVWRSPIKEAQMRGKTEEKIVTCKRLSFSLFFKMLVQVWINLPTLLWDCSRTAETGLCCKDEVIHPFRSCFCKILSSCDVFLCLLISISCIPLT